MHKALKYTAITVATLILVIVAAMMTLTILVNPNDFKGVISKQVYQATGRKLEIRGDLAWSFFPWLGMKVKGVNLSNPTDFDNTNQVFAKIQEADVRVKALPLLAGKIEIGTLLIRDPEIHLITKADGANNWQDLIDRQTKPTPVTPSNSVTQVKEDTSAKKTTDNKTAKHFHLDIANIDIKNAGLTWQDHKNQQNVAIDNLQFSSNDVAFASPFPIDLSFSIKSAKPALMGNINLQTKVMLDPKQQHYQFQDFDLTSSLQGAAIPGKQLDTKFRADIDANLVQQTLRISKLSANVDNVTMQGEVNGSQIISQANYTGQFAITPFNVRQLLQHLGVKYTPKASSALQTMQAKLQFDSTAKVLKVNTFKIKFDQSTLNGKARVNLDTHHINFNLLLDKINLDQYMSAQTKTAANNKPVKKHLLSLITSANAAPTVNKKQAGAADKFAGLRKLNTNGNVQIQNLQVANLKINNIKTQLSASQGKIKLSPIQAQLYKGRLKGSLSLNVTGKVPSITANETLTGVQISPLLKDLANTDKLSGTLNLTSNITARGLDGKAITRSLNGNSQFSLNKGAIKGFDISQQIKSVQGFITKQKIGDTKSQGGITSFAKVTGTAKIKNGVINNNDLLLTSLLFKVNGKGTVNLVNQRINYRLGIQPAIGSNVKVFASIQDVIGNVIPLAVTGTLSNPKIGPDWNIIKAEALKDKGKKLIDNYRKKIDKGLQGLGNSIKIGF